MTRPRTLTLSTGLGPVALATGSVWIFAFLVLSLRLDANFEALHLRDPAPLVHGLRRVVLCLYGAGVCAASHLLTRRLGAERREQRAALTGVLAIGGTLSWMVLHRAFYLAYFGRWDAICLPGMLDLTATIGAAFAAWAGLSFIITTPARPATRAGYPSPPAHRASLLRARVWSHLRSYVTAMRPKPSASWNPKSVTSVLTPDRPDRRTVTIWHARQGAGPPRSVGGRRLS